MTFNERWQALILVIIIIISVSLTKVRGNRSEIKPPVSLNVAVVKQAVVPNFTFNRATRFEQDTSRRGKFSRKWEVLNPQIQARAVLIKSLEDNTVLLSRGSDIPWPAASLTKLLSAVVVAEEVGLNKKIPISRTAVATEGEAGDLRAGEIYISRDLLKIMLLTSSNDAATAFEEYLGGSSFFIKLLNQKAAEIGMTKTVFHDASGLNDANKTTATDMLLLIRYILENQPDILSWTRLNNFLVQPINEVRSRTVFNINSLVDNPDFLGGKTGTSPAAKENLVAIFSLGEKNRVAVAILGSPNRLEEVKNLFDWIKRAYEF
jgi:D-alanyl-D-alanine carboxypeptidase